VFVEVRTGTVQPLWLQ